MRKYQSGLIGENLMRFHNIQENIRKTREAVIFGNRGNDRAVYTEIVESGSTIAWSPHPSLTKSSSRISSTVERQQETKEELTNAEIGLKVREQKREKSDWIMDDPIESESYRKLSMASLATLQQTHVEESMHEMPRPEVHHLAEIDMRLFETLTPEQEQEIYKRLSDRYGTESGRRYLLVRAMTRPEKEIEAWTTTERKSGRKTFGMNMVECEGKEIEPKISITCPRLSDDVQGKMETLVDQGPICGREKIQEPKRWRDALKHSNMASRKQEIVTVVKEVEPLSAPRSEDLIGTSCECGLPRCDCNLVKIKCDVPRVKKICDTDYHADQINNHLITCRNNLNDRSLNDRRVTVLQQHATKFATRDTKDSIYLQSTHDHAENELMKCLIKGDHEGSDKGIEHVQYLANAISENKMIEDQEWRAWRHVHIKMEEENNSEAVDSFDSDIITSEMSDDEFSQCQINYPKSISPSRIPYFKETFDLSNTLFDKIAAKLERIINKNRQTTKGKLQAMKPYTVLLEDKLSLLKDDSSTIKQLCQQIFAENFYAKALTPFSERKRRKRERANKMRKELNKKQMQRKFIEGVQMGKIYRRRKRSTMYTEKENYKGFTQPRQKILRTTGTDKFKCDLVGKDLAGVKLNQKRFHQDYRLIRRMFDDGSKRNKESLWDQGMRMRLETYLGTFEQKSNPTEGVGEDASVSKISSSQSQIRPKKEEQKVQTAPPSSWSYCGSGNAAEALASMVRTLKTQADNNGNLASDRVKTGSLFTPTGQPTTQPGHAVESLKKRQISLEKLPSTPSSTSDSYFVPPRPKHAASSTKTFPAVKTNAPSKYLWKTVKTVR